MTDELQENTLTPGPGEILKQARVSANLTTKDIASKVRLKTSLIEDIEQDNYDINISLTFIRGYLKLYAKNVQVDEAIVLEAFDKLNTQKKEPAKLQSFSRRIANQANDDKLMLVTYLILAVVIALVVIWWFQQSSAVDTSSNQLTEPDSLAAEQQLEPVTESNAKPIPVEGLEEQIPESVDEQQTNSLPINTELEAQAAEQNSLDETSDIIPSELSDADDTLSTDVSPVSIVGKSEKDVTPVELIFEFSGDCWMNLADATGENIAYGVKVKGRVMPVTGIPPFVVTLGAPEVVKISYAGESLDMSFLTPGRIAKFDLPLSD
jgi:cytoskeleton protein RodZ